ncbi:MAG TPA: hypothetical protein P5080_01060 [Candidatus Paceibacterota bacterium]|nr:hypothetical protein [Candidatus Pacearchaeota archaeon]HRZ50562.1 hypothetical protein [Candidatus Paceibacterota bacterium]HSA36283.1 hypothetical protein [Candidatus Paceibacterota bacterium]
MQRPIALLLAAVLLAGILGPVVLVAENQEENATSTDPVADSIEEATTTDDGTAASTEETGKIQSTDPVSDPGITPAGETQPALEPAGSSNGAPSGAAPSGEADILNPNPTVMAAWAMLNNGTDASADPLAQFLPSGALDVSADFQICGAVRPGAGPNDSFGVYSQFSYPGNSAFAPNDAKKRQGCGQAVSPICQMKPLEASNGLELFCQKIKNDNASLPVFGDTGTEGERYNYDAVCAELEKQTAAVYCCGQSLAYDDISGIYRASVIAQNSAGIFSNLLLSNVEYLPITAVQADFNSVNYGTVAANLDKTAQYYGKDGKQTLGAAYIRNLGNTRVRVSIEQNDMGLGKTDGRYNIRYHARYAVGNNPWTYYWPNESAALPGEIDLSTSEAVELGVTVFKYPDALTSEYSGTLTLSATGTDHYQCSNE